MCNVYCVLVYLCIWIFVYLLCICTVVHCSVIGAPPVCDDLLTGLGISGLGTERHRLEMWDGKGEKDAAVIFFLIKGKNDTVKSLFLRGEKGEMDAMENHSNIWLCEIGKFEKNAPVKKKWKQICDRILKQHFVMRGEKWKKEALKNHCSRIIAKFVYEGRRVP